MNSLKLTLATVGAAALFAAAPAQAQIIITEVDPTGNNAAYGADWWEITNYGSSSVPLNGWKMDDSSNSISSAVALNGVSNIAAGQSVVFIENGSSSTSQSTLTALINSFETAWFGSPANAPAGFTIGTYNGNNAGVSLSNGGDGVNLFDNTGTLVTGVSFGSATTGVTFDNSSAHVTNDGTIATLSAVGKNGAFKNSANEIGSPGAVPEPNSGLLAAIVAVAFAGVAYLRRKVQA